MTTVVAGIDPVLKRDLCRAAARLPSSARIFEQIDHVLRNPDMDAAEVIAMIKQDAAVALRVLRLANSVQFARGKPFADLDSAIDWIGLAQVYQLLAVTASANLFCEDLPHYQLTAEQLRRNAVATAEAMRLLANLAGDEPRRAYSLGLFRPVGRLVLQRLANARRVPRPEVHDGRGAAAWERNTLGVCHAEAVEVLFGLWGLNPFIGEVISRHLEPRAGPDDEVAMSAARLHVACWLVTQAGFGLGVEAFAWSASSEMLALARLPNFSPEAYVRLTRELAGRVTGLPNLN